jgi:hypothetical protein
MNPKLTVGLWKLPRYGNSGKANRAFLLFPQRLENSPNNGKFSTVPAAPTAGTSKKRKQSKRNHCLLQLLRSLHFQIEFPNVK